MSEAKSRTKEGSYDYCYCLLRNAFGEGDSLSIYSLDNVFCLEMDSNISCLGFMILPKLSLSF